MKISIITASYNSGKTIRHTVESVLRQTYPDFEYIVVDGGSTDNSIDIVKEYQVAFKGRLKWISEKEGWAGMKPKRSQNGENNLEE